MTGRRAASGQLSLLAECLDEQDRAVLAFARVHHLQGSVADHVERELGCTTTRYLQLLARMLDRPEVAEAAPELVGALRQLRERRRRWRTGP